MTPATERMASHERGRFDPMSVVVGVLVLGIVVLPLVLVGSACRCASSRS